MKTNPNHGLELSPTQYEALRRARAALERIAEAQARILDACEYLCRIDGLCPEWEIVGQEYDRLKALWHKVNLRVNGGGFDLDSDAKRAFEARKGAVHED